MPIARHSVESALFIRIPPDKFMVTIKIERPDGQFVNSVCLVPGNLIDRTGDHDQDQGMTTRKITTEFTAAYIRCAGLPE
jgi:hypothetical protein